MTYDVLAGAKRDREQWLRSIERMETGHLKMHEDGRDVTDEWTERLREKITEIDELVASLEADDA